MNGTEQARPTYCINCGARLAPDARFCHVCGAAVAAILQPVATVSAQPASPPRAATWPDFDASGLPIATGGYASFGERFVALIVDWIILGVFTWLVGIVLAMAVYAAGESSEAANAVFGGIVVLLGVVSSWLYFAIQESSDRQATIGKRAMKIVVTDEQGRRLSFARATGRAFARMLSGLFFFLGYLLAAFTARKQALHDLIVGTLILRR